MGNYEGIKFSDLANRTPRSLSMLLMKLRTITEAQETHPEENVLQHTKIVVERLMKTGDPDLIMAGLFHDLGKWHTKKYHPLIEANVFPNHEKVSASFVENFSDYIEDFGANTKMVENIVLNHVRFKQFENMKEETKSEISNNNELYWRLKVFNQANDMVKEFVYE